MALRAIYFYSIILKDPVEEPTYALVAYGASGSRAGKDTVGLLVHSVINICSAANDPSAAIGFHNHEEL